MDKQKNSLLIGGFLIALGTLFLLDNLNMIYLRDAVLVAVIFIGIGGYLFFRHLQNRQMGTLILAAIAMFVGLAILIDETRIVKDDVIGALFFLGAAALFVYGYFRDRQKWGLLLTAGILVTLGAIVLIEAIRFFDNDLAAGTFFLGLGLTFGLLYLIRNENNRLEWTKVPAVVLIIFAGFVYVNTSDFFLANLVLPLALILLGGYLVYSSIQNRSINKKLESA
jgi:hypothetical protein